MERSGLVRAPLGSGTGCGAPGSYSGPWSSALGSVSTRALGTHSSQDLHLPLLQTQRQSELELTPRPALRPPQCWAPEVPPRPSGRAPPEGKGVRAVGRAEGRLASARRPG